MKRQVLLALCLTLCSLAQAQQVENPEIKKVLAAMDAFSKKEYPGDTLIANPLGSYKEEDFLRRYQFNKEQFNSLAKIDAKQLSKQDNISRQLLMFTLDNEVKQYEFKDYLNPILADAGFHADIAFIASTNIGNKKEMLIYINKLKDLPRYMNQHMDFIRTGLKLGICQPVIALKGYESTYNTHLVDSEEKSLFYQPLKQRPIGISETDWTSLLAEAKSAIKNDVIPSYRKVKEFFEKEYFPKTRTTLGASHYPNGKQFYAWKVKYYTTTSATPEEVYQTGLREVSRIEKEMQQVLDEVQFKGTIKEYIDVLRNDPKSYPATAIDLLKEASYISKKIDGKLPLLFGKLPRQPYGVEPVPDFLAPSYTAGRYSGASIKSKRAGEYWVNTYKLESRTLYTLEALSLHEAVPGHHLQGALTQELDHLPEFRRNLYINAFGEGWGLYSEFLGYELGLYKDPRSRFGRLTYEMWRACRLVIDVGIHDKDWTRDQAVSYLADRTALSLHEVNTEINRYISWPGQALAYKTGEIKIKELRKRAEEQLKEKFDVRAFHDLVLSEGTLTMQLLEEMVDAWIAKTK